MKLPSFSGKTAFLLCDIQEAFRPVVYNFPKLVHVSERMISASEILQIPLIVTEHYPKGLGNTVSELKEKIKNVKIYEKKLFSMITPPVEEELQRMEIDNVVLFGLEAHVCIYQTALDLLKSNRQVHLVADGISARHQFNIDLALDQLRHLGAFVSSSESILFQIMKSADHPNFKAISNLVKQSNL